METAPITLFAGLSLGGCVWITDSELDERRDYDDDGYVSVALGGTDCDDQDARVNPGAPEECDAVDRDCNGYTGLDDRDADGYRGCEECDDDDAAIHPGADEVCDDRDVDEDCDGLANDDDPSTLGFIAQWPDADGDGSGRPGIPEERCALESGWIDNDADCDDTEPRIPAPREVCRDGHDNDCDGTTDVCVPIEVPDGDATFSNPDLNTVLGAAATLRDDVDGDGLADLLLGSASVEERGGGLVMTGPLPSSGGIELSSYRLHAPAPNWQAHALTTNADLTGDGVPDIAVGGYSYTGQGAVHIVTAPLTTDVALADVPTLTSSAADQSLGRALGAGDFDGDGIDDLVVGEPNARSGMGAAWLLTELPDNTSATPLLTTLGVEFYGPSDYLIGARVAGGQDISGDGNADAVALSEDGDQGVGEVYLLRHLHFPSLGTHAELGVWSADRVLLPYGHHLDDLELVPDVDGDGGGDLWLAGQDDAGQVRGWLVYGPIEGKVELENLNLSPTSPQGVAVTSPLRVLSGDVLVTGGGDANGDGIPDLALAAPIGQTGPMVSVLFGWQGLR